MRSSSLALRSLFWTLLLPGTFAFFVPWRFFGLRDVAFDPGNALHLVGGALAVAGAALLITCIVEFARSGRGTLSPADPPKQLVVQGLYRYVRNPMYLSVLTIVAGWIALTRSGWLATYWLGFFACANVFVIGYEERRLRAQFGEDYRRYAQHVGRWIPTWPRGDDRP